MPRPWVVHGRSLFRLIQPGLDGMEPTDRGLDFCAPPNSLCELADYMATQLLSFSPRGTMCGKGRICRGLGAALRMASGPGERLERMVVENDDDGGEMPGSEIKLEVLNPRGEISGAEMFGASQGLGDLNGRKIGILNNTKSGGDLLLPYVLEAIKGQHPDVEFKEWRVPFMLDPAEKAPRLKEVAEYADGVIALTGD